MAGSFMGSSCLAMKLPAILKMYTQFEETEETSEPDMARILELSDCEFKTSMINMLRAING